MNKSANYPLAIRLWHWLSALVVSGLLLTIILTATVSKVTANARLVRASLARNNIAITDRQSLAIGRALNAKYWELHLWLGYALAALFVFRFAAELFLPAEERLPRKIVQAYRDRLRHGFWVKLIYAIFYLVMAISVLTGLLLSLQDRYPVLQQYGLIHELHELDTYLFFLFISTHVAGVLLAERRKSKGVVSRMISG